MTSTGVMEEFFFSTFVAVSVLGIMACLLALCTLCRRKSSKRSLPQGNARLVEAPPVRQTELSESASKSQKLNRGKSQSSTIATLPFPLREEDGTVSVSSFTILTQRQLPKVPAEETYSNLTCPRPTQEMLYESVAVTGEGDPSSRSEVEEGSHRGSEGWASRAEYASVRKVMGTEEPVEVEVGDSQVAPAQQPCPARTAVNPHTVQVEEMYSVVCKAGKKRDPERGEGGSPCQVAISCQGPLTTVHQEPSCRAGPWPSSTLPLVAEPCYDAVSCEPRVLPNGREVAEPAYETVDAHWKPSKRKAKAKRPVENLYESIENLTLELRNQNLSSSET